MSKAVLMSIQPKWVELIANGKKTIEIRKTKPKLQTPFKVYIYCTRNNRKHAFHTYINSGYGRENFGVIGNWRSGKDIVDVNSHLPAYRYNAYLAEGKVIGYFVCDYIDELHEHELVPQGKHYRYEKARLDLFLEQSCLSYGQLSEYRKNLPCHKPLYGWHITNLVIYDQPKELSEFWLYNEELHKRYESDEDYCAWGNSTTEESGSPTNDCEGIDLLQCYQCWEYWSGWCHKLKKAPQSWCYVEELDND